MSGAPASSSTAPEVTVTATGTFCRLSSRLRAVTTIDSPYSASGVISSSASAFSSAFSSAFIASSAASRPLHLVRLHLVRLHLVRLRRRRHRGLVRRPLGQDRHGRHERQHRQHQEHDGRRRAAGLRFSCFARHDHASPSWLVRPLQPVVRRAADAVRRGAVLGNRRAVLAVRGPHPASPPPSFGVGSRGSRPKRSRRMNSSTACCGLMPRCMGTPKHFSTVKK